MGQIISEVLAINGYKNVLNTEEKVAMMVHKVSCRIPYTWDTNNGVTVVYDENGEPWIKRGKLFVIGEMKGNLYRGAHVPHSNDGGHFVNNVLPKL